MDKTKYNVDGSTVLVIDGVPHSLVRDKGCPQGIVCHKCSLRELCGYDEDKQLLISLCMSDDRSPAWYFEIDWDILDNKIRDYIDLGVAAEEDKL